MAPLNKRILTAGATVHHSLGESFVQPTMTSAALRRVDSAARTADAIAAVRRHEHARLS